jgi:small subunit ribosomal protein S18
MSDDDRDLEEESGRRRGGYSRGGGRRTAGGSGGYRGRFAPRRKVCAFCLEKAKVIDYKDVGTLRRFLTDRGKIRSRRKTGTCAKHQRRLAIAVKRARHLALLPFTAEHIRRY